MKKLITVVGMLVISISAYGQHGQQRCIPQPRQCYQPSRSHYSGHSYYGGRERGGLSLSIGLGGVYAGYGSGYSQYPQRYYAPVQYQQPVYVEPPQYQQPVYAPQQYQQQVVYAAPQVQYQQPVYVQQNIQSPVYIAPAPQVGGLLPQQPVQQRTVPVGENTPITRTTTSYYSSGGSVTVERFR